jgi:hypothetical protein
MSVVLNGVICITFEGGKVLERLRLFLRWCFPKGMS